MITEGQVRVAIQVLRDYIILDLPIPAALIADLEDAIADAFSVLPDEQRIEAIVCEIDDDPPFAPSS